MLHTGLHRLLLSTAAAAILASAAPARVCKGDSAAASPPSVEVTTNHGLVTVAADHADVKGLLKAVFDRVDRQFSLAESVSGRVTLRLKKQPLRDVLDAICAQTFSRYTVTPGTGIFVFQSDDAAILAAFSRLRTLNGELRANLRGAGMGVPDEAWFGQGATWGLTGDLPAVNRTGQQAAYVGKSSIVIDRTATSRVDPTYQPAPAFGAAQQFALNAVPSTVVKVPSTGGLPSASASISPGAIFGAPQRRLPVGYARSVDNSLSYAAPSRQLAPSVAGSANREKSAMGSEIDSQGRQDHLVSFRIPRGRPVPVADLLRDLGRQANVVIVIGPDVPAGDRFRIDGHLSPRPLADALNAIAPVADLEWRWVGDRVFVATTPNLRVHFISPPASSAQAPTGK